MRAFIVAAIVGLGSLPRAIAWGAAGHEIVATIAQSYLDPQVLNTVCSILSSDPSVDQVRGDGAPCYLSTVATWADKIRFRARWSSQLHFINAAGDHPPDDCRFPGANGWAGKERANVLDAVHNVSSILTDFMQGSSSSAATGAPELAQEALKFLVHFIGDMHQPLHLSGRDRGGNSDKVHWGNRCLIAKAIRLTPRNYTRPVALPFLESSLRDAIYDPYIRRIVWEGFGSDQVSVPPPPNSAVDAPWAPQDVLAAPRKPRPAARGPPLTSDSDMICPYGWTAPIHKLNCDIVWPPELDNPETHGRAPRREYLELDTPKYSGRIEKEWIVEKLLAQGGVRLAGILNYIFAPQQ
ncbi:S1/P1 nuclease-domain-containing protein [Russula vinacea]|nr:S1/P1 nuclease-domain-containing protein [Russula vinacea]